MWLSAGHTHLPAHTPHMYTLTHKGGLIFSTDGYKVTKWYVTIQRQSQTVQVYIGVYMINNKYERSF